jgi:hypothetical protein
MARPSDPKALRLYRTAEPAGWAACHVPTGLTWRISGEEAERIRLAHVAAAQGKA